MKWKELLNILDCGKYMVQIKGSSKNYAPKIQCFTSNTPLRELYNYAEDQKYLFDSKRNKKNNRKYYASLIDRFDFVIEYYKFRKNEEKVCENKCYCCEVMRIFHHGFKEKFNNQEFEIEFNEDVSKKKAILIIEEKDELFFRKGKRFYWRPQINYDKFILSEHENFEKKKPI
ncbi:23472_t:CDS:1 [Dentiscutata erythropus]|uniref:23472_t:CDS:1 n=1 Tax=Dentiscutata erythropus TaxID=1348616 RepID=A0A9N9JUV0_9GLOM|nr:23472_t:CDS:1 [Dentiscutata erythropus]